MDYFQQKNNEFFDFLNETFKIKSSRRWSDITNNISVEKISLTYKYFSELFPLNIDYSEKLKSDSHSFKSIHYNTLKPNSIISEVVRYSLYSDEIYVFHPLQNPSITNPNMNPIKFPRYWLQNFMESLYFYIVLQKWVRSGIVKLIINPSEFDFKLRDSFDEKAKIRVKEFLSDPRYKEISMESAEDAIAEELALSYKGKTLTEIRTGLLNLKNPRFTEIEADDFSKKIFSKINNTNPLYVNLNIKPTHKSIITTRGGGNLESILHIADITNGSIYTTSNSNWLQLSKLENVDFWTKVSHLYSKINLNFLDSVDTSYALNLRKDDRLSGVRTAFRKIYSSLNSQDMNELSESKMIELNEDFIEEIKKADAEWKFIKNEANNKRQYWALATIGLPVVSSEVSILPLMLGSSLWLSHSVIDEKIKMEKLRHANPLSVYIDLQHKEPNFFSELKNCIF